MSSNCDILHPFFKSKCILMRNHLGEDSSGFSEEAVEQRAHQDYTGDAD